MHLETTLRIRLLFTLTLLLLGVSAGQAATIRLNPDDSLVFAGNVNTQVAQTVSVTNTTGLPILVNASANGNAAFTVSGVTSMTLLGGQTGQIVVLFNPTVTGTANGTLNVTSGNETESLDLIGYAQSNASGTLNAAGSVNIGGVSVGEEKCVSIQVTNPNLSAYTITDVALWSNSASFSQQDSAAVTIGPLMSAPVTVCYKPTTVNEEANATLTVYYSSADSSVSDSLTIYVYAHATNRGSIDSSRLNLASTLEFENVTVGDERCLSLDLLNPTLTAARADNISITGPAASSFSYNGASSILLGAGMDTSVTICYHPAEFNDDAKASLNFTLYSATGNVFLGNYRVRLHGSTVEMDSIRQGTHCLRVRQNNELFGPVIRGGVAHDTITVTNTTNSDITLQNLMVGGDASSFTVLSSFPATIASQQSIKIAVQFMPSDSTRVRYDATLTLNASGNNLQCENTLQIHVGGIGVPGPNVHADTTHGLFDHHGNGVVVVEATGHGSLDTLHFVNNLPVPVVVTNVGLQSGVDFNIVSTSPTLPVTLEPGASLDVVVAFQGNTSGFFNDNLIVTTQDAQTAQTIQLQTVVQVVASVRANAEGIVRMSVTPNPSAGPLTVSLENVQRARVDVLDLLGNIVTASDYATGWKWTGETSMGTQAASGAYLIRVTGLDANGQEFHMVRQVLLQK